MNKEKTKIIWIGRKRFSKFKLNVSQKLDWGCTDFTFLGLHFSVNLDDMCKINYSKTIKIAEAEIIKWQSRNLTPIGKITIIKTKILSKFIHLFLSIPITKCFLEKLNRILFQFLWNKKPDKIKRATICTMYQNGGLNMVNIYNFEKCLKVSWMRRLQSQSQWCILLQETISEFERIFVMGPEWCNFLKQKVSNKFWSDVFQSWAYVGKELRINSNSDIMQSCLWYNKHISENQMFLPLWFKKDIYTVGDITDSSGKVLGLVEINKKFNLKVNFLHYFRLRAEIQSFIQKNKKDNFFPHQNPVFPPHLHLIMHQKKGCKDIYLIINETDKKEQTNCELKWSQALSINNDDIWPTVYKICFKSISDNVLVWFQYRLLYNILNTNDYLHKVKIKENKMCNMCNEYTETCLHLFSDCIKAEELWNNIETWLKNKTGIPLVFTAKMKILGYLIYDQFFWPINFILLLSRNYIFQTSRKNSHLNIFCLQKEFKRKFLEQKYLAETDTGINLFKTRWGHWVDIFSEIEL